MGNQVSCGLTHSPPTYDIEHVPQDGAGSGSTGVVKLVHCNGMVDEFYRGVRVGELTVDYPQHFIVHSSDVAAMLTSDWAPMPDDSVMEPGHLYFLLHRTLLDAQFTRHDAAALLAKAALARKQQQQPPRHFISPRLLQKLLRASMDSHVNHARISPHADLEADFPDLDQSCGAQQPAPPQPPHVISADGPQASADLPQADYIRRLLQEARQLINARSPTGSHAPPNNHLSSHRRSFSSASPPSSWRPALETIDEFVLVSSSSGGASILAEV